MTAKEFLGPELDVLSKKFAALFKGKIAEQAMGDLIVGFFDAATPSHWQDVDQMCIGDPLARVQEGLATHNLKNDAVFVRALCAQIVKDVQIASKQRVQEQLPGAKGAAYLDDIQQMEKSIAAPKINGVAIDQSEINKAIERVNELLSDLDTKVKKSLESGRFDTQSVNRFEAKKLWLTLKLRQLIAVMEMNYLIQSQAKSGN